MNVFKTEAELLADLPQETLSEQLHRDVDSVLRAYSSVELARVLSTPGSSVGHVAFVSRPAVPVFASEGDQTMIGYYGTTHSHTRTRPPTEIACCQCGPNLRSRTHVVRYLLLQHWVARHTP